MIAIIINDVTFGSTVVAPPTHKEPRLRFLRLLHAFSYTWNIKRFPTALFQANIWTISLISAEMLLSLWDSSDSQNFPQWPQTPPVMHLPLFIVRGVSSWPHPQTGQCFIGLLLSFWKFRQKILKSYPKRRFLFGTIRVIRVFIHPPRLAVFGETGKSESLQKPSFRARFWGFKEHCLLLF